MNEPAGFGNRKKSHFVQLAELTHNVHNIFIPGEMRHVAELAWNMA